jgi:hypothetical protein
MIAAVHEFTSENIGWAMIADSFLARIVSISFASGGRVIINNDKATPGREKLPAPIRASARENWIRHDRIKYAQIIAPFESGTGGAGNKGFPDVAGKTGTVQAGMVVLDFQATECSVDLAQFDRIFRVTHNSLKRHQLAIFAPCAAHRRLDQPCFEFDSKTQTQL